VVDITEISAMVAAAGVLVGVVYYILDMRNQTKMRQTDLLVRLCSVWQTKDWLEAWSVVDGSRYGQTTLDLDKIVADHRDVEVNEVVLFFDEIGVLLQMGLVDIELVERLTHGHAKRTWEKLKPAIEGYRKARNDSKLVEGFEYLYNELKKREQQLTSKTA
jgi:hypothetical protein